jgi:hypothetical protein
LSSTDVGKVGRAETFFPPLRLSSTQHLLMGLPNKEKREIVGGLHFDIVKV